MTLEFIIAEERKRSNNIPTNTAEAEMIKSINPVLYFLFIVDWERICTKRIPSKFDGDGVAFGRNVMADWLTFCCRKSYFKTGMLNNYNNDHQVMEVITHLTDSKLHYLNPDTHQPSPDYSEMEGRMWAIRESALEAEREADRQKQEQQQIEAAAQRKREEAERKASAMRNEAPAPTAPPAASFDLAAALLETQRLIDHAPVGLCRIKLFTRPEDEAEPFSIELAPKPSDPDNKAIQFTQPEHFTAPTAEVALHKVRTYMAQIIDQVIAQRQRDEQRTMLQQQIEQQNTAFEQMMAEQRRMMEQMQQTMREQQQQHEAQVAALQQQIAKL